MTQIQHKYTHQPKKLTNIFSKEFLEQLKQDVASKTKPSKSILEALMKLKQLNDSYKRQNQALLSQVKLLKSKNEELNLIISKIETQNKQLKQQNLIKTKVKRQQHLQGNYENELKGTIDKLNRENQSLRKQLMLLKSLASRKIISQNLLQEPSVFILSETSNHQLQNYLCLNKANHRRFSSQNNNFLQVNESNKTNSAQKQDNKSVNLNQFIDSQIDIS